VWFAIPELNDQRYWDERYGMENIRALVDRGKIRPANGYHPSLSYLPQAAVLAVVHGFHEWTGEPRAKVFQGKSVTPLGYLLCRLLQVFFGLCSLFLVYVIGCRMASPEVGVVASFVLAVSPWHLRQSVIYKPDILLLVTLELAFLASLWALRKPGLRRYLWAGGAVGLALATKFNAGPIALPLALGTWLQGWKDRRRWMWLIAAGLVAAGVFLALNPFVLLEPGLYQEDFSRTLRDYERKAVAEQKSQGALLLHAGSSLLDVTFHGAWVGALGLAGLVYLLVIALHPATKREEREKKWVFLAFPLSYVLFYVLVTTNPSAHNWLPLLPFTSVAAGIVGVGLARWLAGFRPRGWRTPSLALIACIVAALLLVPPNRFVYRAVVPTTMVRAQQFLEQALDPISGRVVAYEEDLEPLSLKEAVPAVARALAVKNLSAMKPEELDLYDAVVVSRERFEGGAIAAFGAGTDRKAMRVLESKSFHARGEDLVAVARPWIRRSSVELAGEVEKTPGPRSVTLMLPPRRADSMMSFELWIPSMPSWSPPPAVEIDGVRLELLRVNRNRFLVPRLRAPAGAREVVVFWKDAPPRCRRALLTGHVWDRPLIPEPAYIGD